MTASAAQAGPPGLKLAYEVISPAEEAELIELINGSALTYFAQDPDNPRSSRSYGWRYVFSTDGFEPCGPIPEEFRPFCASAARFAGVDPDDFAECLFNRYEDGAIIQPHFDKPVFDLVVGASLGAPATMRFLKPSDPSQPPVDIVLPPRSLYLMSGDARHLWQHSVLPVEGTRWSITLRTLSAQGARLIEQYAGTA